MAALPSGNPTPSRLGNERELTRYNAAALPSLVSPAATILPKYILYFLSEKLNSTVPPQAYSIAARAACHIHIILIGEKRMVAITAMKKSGTVQFPLQSLHPYYLTEPQKSYPPHGQKHKSAKGICKSYSDHSYLSSCCQ
jgi:hypothetical protein